MPPVPETKVADVGKLISLGNLLVRKVTWFVLTTTSVTLIFVPRFWSRLHDKNCLYILSSFKNSFLSISTHKDNTFSYTATHRDNSLFPFWLPERTHSLLHLTSSTQPYENVYIPQPFSFLSDLYGLTCYSLENNHRNFVKPPKKTNNQHGRRHVPPNIHN